MAAPSSVYKDFKTRRRKAGTPDVDIDLFIAKFLQNTTPPSGDDWGDGYFNSTDTEAEKIAKIKGIFKIDGWVQVAKGTATTPDMGFIGYCNSRTSGNGLYHKTERFSGVRVPTSAQASAELLNDGSLNLMGTCSISAVASDLENNAINVTGVFRSSFYNPTTAFGVEWSGVARRHLSTGYDTPTTWTRDIDKGTIAPKIKVTQTATQYQEQYATDPYYEFIAGEEYTITPYITNEEGRKEGTPITHLMSGISAQMSYGTTAVLAASSTTYETLYKWNRGLAFYQEGGGDLPMVQGTRYDMTPNGSSGGEYPDAGWWAYQQSGSFRLCVKLDDFGTCIAVMYVDVDGSGGSGTPPTNYASYTVAGQGASAAAAETDAYANLFVTQYTITYSATEREWGRLVLVGEDFVWETADGYYYNVAGQGLLTSGETTWYVVDYQMIYINAGVLTNITVGHGEYIA